MHGCVCEKRDPSGVSMGRYSLVSSVYLFLFKGDESLARNYVMVRISVEAVKSKIVDLALGLLIKNFGWGWGCAGALLETLFQTRPFNQRELTIRRIECNFSINDCLLTPLIVPLYAN